MVVPPIPIATAKTEPRYRAITAGLERKGAAYACPGSAYGIVNGLGRDECHVATVGRDSPTYRGW